jgi:hypothetical protein
MRPTSALRISLASLAPEVSTSTLRPYLPRVISDSIIIVTAKT